MEKNNKSRNKIFNSIAPIYGLFYGYQKRHYNTVLDKLQDELDLGKYKNIIDIGCGTGALSSVLYQRGFAVTGVDPARKMIKIAMKKPENKAINFIQANALERLPFDDKSFDVSILSYVIHGLKENERKVIYGEMSRITREVVIFYDYNENRSILTDIVEWLEGGNYFDFIKKSKTEMIESFQKVNVLKAGVRSSWYICIPKE